MRAARPPALPSRARLAPTPCPPQLSHGIDVMIGITNDLLDVEALRLGKLKIVAAPADVREVLAGCAKPIQGVAVSLSVASDVPAKIIVDPLRLRQVRPRTRLRVLCVWARCRRALRRGVLFSLSR